MPTSNTTDFGGLAPEKTSSTARRWFVSLVVIGGLWGGGVGIGYYAAVQQARQDIQQLNTRHQAEIERLQTAYGRSIDSTAKTVNEAAQTVERAAQTVDATAAKTLANPKPQEPRK
jgi:hypothetical protein